MEEAFHRGVVPAIALAAHALADPVLAYEIAIERREGVNGAPAQITILQSPCGTSVSILTWIEGRREYQLMMDANVNAAGSPNLLELARSLPKSVPGGQLDGGFKGFPATWDGK